MFRVLSIVVLLLTITAGIKGQELPYHISNKAVYDFIDELANKGIIELNTTIKPYSRLTIAQALEQASGHPSLSNRQREELAFYLKDFNKELKIGKDFDKRFDVFYHSDSLLKVTVNPILGGQFFNNGDKTVYHRWGGAEFYGTIGKNLAIYGSLRDNHESRFLGGPEYISQRDGAVYKGDNLDKDYSETRGGIVYSWKWGSVGLHKDHLQWGSGYNAHSQLINSAQAPSFGFISFSLKPVKWLDFHYYHGWLVSEVVDSSRTYQVYNGDREVYANKFIASNMFTLRPWSKLNISFGNSIIYGDTDFNPTFLVPFLFFKSADHTYNSWDNWVGHNAQMFIDISSRQIKNLHLYTSLFIDEIALTKMFDEEQKSNDVAIKVGFRATDLLPNTSLTAEYTRIRPLVYEHFIPTITYKSNQYVMGHYLRDNAEELYLSLGFKPLRGLDLKASYTWFRKGKDYQKIFDSGTAENHPEINLDSEEIRLGLPFLNEERYKNQSISFKASYQIVNDGYIFVEATKNSFAGPDKELYTNPYYLDGDQILSFGMNFGF
ncbi:hypothetical protein [Carboxylicivirga taeanensis]|uniref:hypothetical protein n=1 Tax=Carboxylicivirga taeanensis TaxID=1416875 RepID=UPI003F6DE0D9